MSTGGANSCNGSPIISGQTTRRRVGDFVDAERSNLSDFSEEEDNNDGSNGGNYHPVMRYLIRRRVGCLPESWLLRMESMVLCTILVFQSLRSGKKMGRRIFGILIFLAVALVFVKFSTLSSHVEVNGKRKEKGILILQTFKDDWAMAQKIVTERDGSDAVMPKRLLEKFPICYMVLLHDPTATLVFSLLWTTIRLLVYYKERCLASLIKRHIYENDMLRSLAAHKPYLAGPVAPHYAYNVTIGRRKRLIARAAAFTGMPMSPGAAFSIKAMGFSFLAQHLHVAGDSYVATDCCLRADTQMSSLNSFLDKRGVGAFHAYQNRLAAWTILSL
ncbi:hypothetical protein HHK36_031697 [Tetracentron sinense]|uniref:Uncharacterized protein n=1 Tax=Tetracentron sinense TaxID=13715 RepID=A0A835CYA5_TETSI|nr:hypothetical protein HHK36_031697 [Tetracentron sinense]